MTAPATGESARALEAFMAQFCGTQRYYRAGSVRDFYVTDGVIAVAVREAALWFLDAVSTHARAILERDEFAVVRLEVAHDGATTFTADDGREPATEYARQRIGRSGFTPGRWTFYLERAPRADGTWFAVLLLPGEH